MRVRSAAFLEFHRNSVQLIVTSPPDLSETGDGKTGVTYVFHEDSPDKYTNVAEVKTIYGARTIAVDPKTHHIFSISTEKNDPVPPTA